MKIKIDKANSGAYVAEFLDVEGLVGVASTSAMAIARLFRYAILRNVQFTDDDLATLEIYDVVDKTVHTPYLEPATLEEVANGNTSEHALDAVNYHTQDLPRTPSIEAIQEAQKILDDAPVPRHNRSYYCMLCDTTCDVSKACECPPSSERFEDVLADKVKDVGTRLEQPTIIHGEGETIKVPRKNFIDEAMSNVLRKVFSNGTQKAMEKMGDEIRDTINKNQHVSQSKVQCYLCSEWFVNQKFLDKHKCKALEME